MKKKILGKLIRLVIKIGSWLVDKHTKELQKEVDRGKDIERSDVFSEGDQDNRRASDSEVRIRAGLRAHI